MSLTARLSGQVARLSLHGSTQACAARAGFSSRDKLGMSSESGSGSSRSVSTSTSASTSTRERAASAVSRASAASGLLRCGRLASPSLVSRRAYTAGAGAANVPAGSLQSIGIGNLQPLAPPKKRKRVGRGHSSGRGKTSTRGHKGQKARSGNGKPVPGFAGGQTPITRQFPKRGFTNIFAKDYALLTLPRLQHWIETGRLDVTQPITAHELYTSKCIHSYKDGVKLMGNGASRLSAPIDVVVSRATPSAIAAIEQAGGSVVCKYYTPSSLDALVNAHKLEGRLPPRDPDPVAKKDLVYYASTGKRGYLSGRVPTERSIQSPKTFAAGEAEHPAAA